jgi:WD40 repeat protein
MHARAHEQAITSLAVSLDGARWASASLDGGVALWDDKSDKPAYRVAAHENWCRAVAFAPNGRFLASGGLDSVVHVWNVQTVEGRAPLLSGSKDFPILHGQKEVWTVAFINDGKTILAGGNGVTAWDTSTKSHRWYLNGHAERVTDLTISPDQKKMATCSFDGTFCVWDVETQKVLYRGHAGVGSLWKVLFTPDSRQLLTGGGGSVVEGEWQPGDDFTIRVWAVK